MSASIILLCEDSQTDSFVRRFLRNRNIRARDIYTLPLPGGSGEQWVREHYPYQLKAIRRKQKAILIVVIDADLHTTAFRRSQLDLECDRKHVPRRELKDPVMVVVPRRNIETWFAYLKGDTDIDETQRYPKLKRESDCRSFAKALHRMCHERQQLAPSAPPSLIEACREYSRLSLFVGS